MFGCIVAGRLVQTNLQQVDVNKFIFQLDDAGNINHIVVFLLGTIPFQPGYAATVHLLWPNKTWQLLGMLSNDKASAIFRLKATTNSRSHPPLAGAIGSAFNGNDMSMDTPAVTSAPSTSVSITATLGISIEPVDTVMAQIGSLSSSSTLSSANQTSSSSSSGAVGTASSSNALVPLSTATAVNRSPDSVAAVAQKVMTHLYNHVTSFATAVLPPGSSVLVPAGGPGSAAAVLAGTAGVGAGAGAGAGPDSSYLPVRAFNDWFQNVVRKAKADPMFLTRD